MDRNVEEPLNAEWYFKSLSARRAWIEILWGRLYKALPASLSARRAWIEIVYPGTWSGSILVALRKESVDRNNIVSASITVSTVALRKESVDRNPDGSACLKLLATVALRKESVDRNATMQIVIIVVDTVALRKESVDRNPSKSGLQPLIASSLSARRAWIEITSCRRV